MKEFHEKLKTYRKNNKMTQQQFADRIRISRQAYQSLENGKSNPSYNTYIKIIKLSGGLDE